MTISPHETIELELSEPLLKTLIQYAHRESLLLDRALQLALQDFLTRQGYSIEPRKRLRITPAQQGSGITNTSTNHDALPTQSPKWQSQV